MGGMKVVLPLFIVAVLVGGSVAAHAQGTNTFDPTKTNERFAPGSADTTVTPEVKDKKQADTLQSRRFRTPDQLKEKTEAAVGDKRAPIDVTETREKKIIPRKTSPLDTKPVERAVEQTSRLDGQRARIQTNQLFATDRPNRFQDSIKNAAPLMKHQEPIIEKRASNRTINRFAFLRNGPDSDSEGINVVPVGRPPGVSGATPASTVAP
ncbi:hypothetical protein OpiT1DRAFT_01639 [Opitutaceae bacterium TAV1]|nr:hypothetical protein OpiT1DRAFT_01639 [Opitutaceae bacterium TAV1]